MRPPHLLDDDVFDELDLWDVTNQIAMWTQTKAVLESNSLKAKKNEKSNLKTNTAIKKVTIVGLED